MVNMIDDVNFNGYVIAAVEGYGTCLHVLRFWKTYDNHMFGHWLQADDLAKATFYKTSGGAISALKKRTGTMALAIAKLRSELKDTFPDVEFQVMQVHGTMTLNRSFTLSSK